MEISERTALSHHSSSVGLCHSSNAWCWALDPSTVFIVKALMDVLVGAMDNYLSHFYAAIGKDCYSKQIKIFLWELSLGAINTADCLQHRMPYMCISPSWCHMSHQHAESPVHLFLQCPFAANF